MFLGPPIDDLDLLERLPLEHRSLLARSNGYVAYNGGLHIRGACIAPEWHSLRQAWDGDFALHRLFPTLDPGDIPFGQDALGDQYILRGSSVFRLLAETGDLEDLGLGLVGFDAAVRANPVDFLNLGPLEAFRAEGGRLEPGQLLSVYPPYCVDTGTANRSFRAVAAADRIRFLASLAAQIRNLPDATAIEFKIGDIAS